VEHRLGITVPVAGEGLIDLPARVRTFADLGFSDVWSSEANGADAFTPLVVTAIAEPRLTVGTAIAGYLTRGPALLAQTAAALAELAPGRTLLGIGASSAPMVGGWNGQVFDTRIQRAREEVDFLRAAFSGETVRSELHTIASTGFRLARAPDPAPPVLLAALGPRMIRLGLEHADGVVLNWIGAGDVPGLLGDVPEGATVVCRVMVVPDGDAGKVRESVRRLFAGYLNVPTYRSFQTRLGRSELLAETWDRWDRGDRKGSAASVPDEVIDQLVVHGDPTSCGEHLARYRRAGITTPVVALMHADDVAPTTRASDAALEALAAGYGSALGGSGR
jgi:probable F420-dependent oxidoreductase